MKKNKKLFIYTNKIILTDGSVLKVQSNKYFDNYQLNTKIFKEKKSSFTKKNHILLKKYLNK